MFLILGCTQCTRTLGMYGRGNGIQSVSKVSSYCFLYCDSMIRNEYIQGGDVLQGILEIGDQFGSVGSCKELVFNCLSIVIKCNVQWYSWGPSTTQSCIISLTQGSFTTALALYIGTVKVLQVQCRYCRYSVGIHVSNVKKIPMCTKNYRCKILYEIRYF